MLNVKQEQLLRLLRDHGRVSFVDMERLTRIPASTAYDNVKVVQECVSKYTAMIDFEQLGYPVRKRFLISSKSRRDLVNLLRRHQGLNNLHLTNGWQAYSEHYFRNLREVHSFISTLRVVKPKITEIDVLEEITHERFFSTSAQDV